jgi:uncharacterized membrane protein YccC
LEFRTFSINGAPMSDARPIAEPAQGRTFVRFATRAIGPILFAVRLWASVCLALYVAFKLQLPDPSWAGTTAALVCQPQLGASLRKSSFRLIGTTVGGVAIVLIAAAFAQDRVGFLGALALWAAVCGFAGALLRNFAAYGAGLAGFTAAVIASDVFGPTGGASDEVVTFALFRVVEIVIGIVSAGVVLALTDLGDARRRLGAEFASVAMTALAGFTRAASAADPDEPASRAIRRETMRRVIALDPMIDTAIGEASDLRYRSWILQNAVHGLIETITAWRTLAIHLGPRSRSKEGRDSAPIERIVQEFAPASSDVLRDPARLRDDCGAAARAAARIAADSPSSQLVADATAIGFIGMTHALNGLTLLVRPAGAQRADALAAVYVPDWLPPSIVAVRAFATTALVSLFWIVTAWQSGSTAITFAIIAVVLFPLQGDRAYSAAVSFLVGCVLSAVIAGMILFGLLPRVASFTGLALTLGLAFVPLGVLIAWPWRPMVVSAAAFNLVSFLSLRNVAVYDAAQFYNSVLAILAGVAAGVIMIRIVPPLSPRTRTRRLLWFALRDVRRLAEGRRRLVRTWEGRALARLTALPDEAEPIERAHMASALAVGARILRLRTVAPRFAPAAAVDAALAPIAEGHVAAALEGLAALDRELTMAPPEARIALRLRAAALGVSEELAAYPEFFEQRGRT